MVTAHGILKEKTDETTIERRGQGGQGGRDITHEKGYGYKGIWEETLVTEKN